MGTLGTKKIQFYTMVQVFKFGTKLHLTIYTPANSGTNIEIEDSSQFVLTILKHTFWFSN